MSYNLKFISEERLTEICSEIISSGQSAITNAERDFNKNIVDPFSAIFDASISNITLAEWKEREKARQAQKTLQNAIGDFHQKILGSIENWADLGVGKVVDLISEKEKVIAEIKNKWNTTKGNHKVRIYDDIDKLLQTEHKGYKGYYVAILAKSKFNIPFTPSDNETKTRRPSNENIREIDGASFYELATGEKDALAKLYNTLPYILTKILGRSNIKFTKDTSEFKELAENSTGLMNSDS